MLTTRQQLTPRVIVDATVEPLVFADVIAQGRRPAGQEQTLAESYITAARMVCENYLVATIAPKTLELALDAFVPPEVYLNLPSDIQSVFSFTYWQGRTAIELPMGPVQSVSSVTYTDANGNPQVFTDYALDQYQQPNAIRLTWNSTWPVARAPQFDAVKIRYIAGYNFPTVKVPQPILQAMLLLIDHMMENRTAVDVNVLAELPLGVKFLLDPYRQQMGA